VTPPIFCDGPHQTRGAGASCTITVTQADGAFRDANDYCPTCASYLLATFITNSLLTPTLGLTVEVTHLPRPTESPTS